VLRPGSPIILRRGEPVQITVFNRLAMPLSVHWHGLELESFFDGVGGWSGAPGSIAPPIAPGDSFVVRMTPPRAGTYMYHVHGEEGHELAMGLHGALLVLDDPAKRDTALDKVLLFSDGGARRELGAFVNGTDAPRLTMVAGRAHRLRLIGITGDLPVELVILRGADTVSWRYVARDGAEVTGAPEALEPARRIIGAGTIADVELVPPEPGELTMQVSYGTFGDGSRTVPPRILRRWTAPITIVAPQVSARSREPSSPRR
jgi:FtsP/CotA-like multicopper oxidase with cupredoxin domain